MLQISIYIKKLCVALVVSIPITETHSLWQMDGNLCVFGNVYLIVNHYYRRKMTVMPS